MAFNANVPSTTNTIAADLAAVNANWEYVISGDGTGSRVFRVSKVTVAGNAGDDIDIKMDSVWNGDTIAEETNQDDSDSAGSFYLNANSSEITIKAAALSGNAVACLGTNIYINESVSTSINVYALASSNDIIVYHNNCSTGAAVDLATAMGNGEELIYYIFYITDA